ARPKVPSTHTRTVASSLRLPRTPKTKLFPYTTLFRSAILPSPGVLGKQREIAAVLAREDPGGAFEHLVVAIHGKPGVGVGFPVGDRKSTRLNSSHVKISYAVFCLKKKK